MAVKKTSESRTAGPGGAALESGDMVVFANGGGLVSAIKGDEVTVSLQGGGGDITISAGDIVAHLEGATGRAKKVAPPLAADTCFSLGEARERLRFCDSYNHLPWLLEIAGCMVVEDWLTLLGEAWTHFDNIGPLLGDMEETPFRDLLDDPLDYRACMMSPDECAALEALPEVVTVWRGCYAINKWGLCWSLDKDIAERFPFTHRYRQDGQALLVRAEVARDDILALKLDRGEEEVVAYRPKHVSTSHAKDRAKQPA